MIPKYKRPILLIRQPGDKRGDDSSGLKDLEAGDDVTSSGRGRRVNTDGNPSGGGPSISITGSSAALTLAMTRSFQGLTQGLEDTRVVWSLVGAGELDQQGGYTAPQSLPQDPVVTVRVTSVARPDLWAEKTFTLVAAGQYITFRVSAACSQLDLGGGNSVVTYRYLGVDYSQPFPTVLAGESRNVISTFPMDPDLIRNVRILIYFGTRVRWNTESQHLFTPDAVTPVLYRVDLCADGEFTYGNAAQTFAGSCSNPTIGPEVSVTVPVGTVFAASADAANDEAMAAAETQAGEQMSCSLPQMTLVGTAVDALGQIRLTASLAHWNGALDWTLTIGEGNMIHEDPEAAAISAEDIAVHTDAMFPAPYGWHASISCDVSYTFYFASLDSRWLIGNEDGDTWLVDVEVSVLLLDAAIPFTVTRRWRKFLLV